MYMKDEIEFRAAWLAGDHMSESMDCQKIKAEAHIKQLTLLNSGCPGFDFRTPVENCQKMIRSRKTNEHVKRIKRKVKKSMTKFKALKM